MINKEKHRFNNILNNVCKLYDNNKHKTQTFIYNDHLFPFFYQYKFTGIYSPALYRLIIKFNRKKPTKFNNNIFEVFENKHTTLNL